MGHDPVRRRSKRKARKGKLHAARDREICRVRKRERIPHSKLAKRYNLTEARIAQILKDGGLVGALDNCQKQEKQAPPPPAPTKPKESKESPSERAWFKRWERHCPVLNGMK